jgi:hypothetical protein
MKLCIEHLPGVNYIHPFAGGIGQGRMIHMTSKRAGG